MATRRIIRLMHVSRTLSPLLILWRLENVTDGQVEEKQKGPLWQGLLRRGESQQQRLAGGWGGVGWHLKMQKKSCLYLGSPDHV